MTFERVGSLWKPIELFRQLGSYFIDPLHRLLDKTNKAKSCARSFCLLATFSGARQCRSLGEARKTFSVREHPTQSLNVEFWMSRDYCKVPANPRAEPCHYGRRQSFNLIPLFVLNFPIFPFPFVDLAIWFDADACRAEIPQAKIDGRRIANENGHINVERSARGWIRRRLGLCGKSFC